jgi:hypothetical protein
MERADKSKSQADKFREAASEAETDDREEAFDAALKKLVKVPSGKKSPTAKTHRTATPSNET